MSDDQSIIERHAVARWALNFTLILAAFGALYLFQSGNVENNRQTRRDFCVEVEQVRTYARDAATRALATLPTLSYYRQHPRELKRALNDVQHQIDFFSPPLNCDKFAETS